MAIWLRQIAAVAHDLDAVEAAAKAALDISVVYRDTVVLDPLGLRNAMMPIGNEFLEVVAPFRENTAGGRYLDRRNGDGGYMIILQSDDFHKYANRIKELGIKFVNYSVKEDFCDLQAHPRDTGGTFLEICQQRGPQDEVDDGRWDPAGANWKEKRSLKYVTGIVAGEIQADDPEVLAARWSDILEIPLTRTEQGNPKIELPNAYLRFVPCTDGRPEGLGGMDVKVSDRQAILDGAAAHNIPNNGVDQIYLTGLRVNLV